MNKMIDNKKIIIIGAGIGGLSAGYYAQLNGFSTIIIDAQKSPGGITAIWKKNGLSINGVNYFILGVNKNYEGYYQIWRELDIIHNIKFYNPEEYIRIEPLDGNNEHIVNYYTNIDKLEKKLLEISPIDSHTIYYFTNLARKVNKYKGIILPAPEFITAWTIIKLLLQFGINFFLLLFKLQRITLGQFADKFKSPILRSAFRRIYADPDNVALLSPLWILAYSHSKTLGVPKGGAISIINKIEENFLKLGGQIYYQKKAVECIIKNKKIIGLKTADGEIYKADYIIWAGDIHNLLYDILDKKYLSSYFQKIFRITKPASSCCMVQIFLNKNILNNIPNEVIWYSIPFLSPFEINNEKNLYFQYTIRQFSNNLDNLSNSGVLICAYLLSNFDCWNKFIRGSDEYKKKKEELLNKILDTLENRYNGLKKAIELTDIATPLTFYRYTLNWKGSAHGFCHNPKYASLIGGVKRKVKGIDNLLLAGDWVCSPASIPSAAHSGKSAIELICRESKIIFRGEKNEF